MNIFKIFPPPVMVYHDSCYRSDFRRVQRNLRSENPDIACQLNYTLNSQIFKENNDYACYAIFIGGEEKFRTCNESDIAQAYEKIIEIYNSNLDVINSLIKLNERKVDKLCKEQNDIVLYEYYKTKNMKDKKFATLKRLVKKYPSVDRYMNDLQRMYYSVKKDKDMGAKIDFLRDDMNRYRF